MKGNKHLNLEDLVPHRGDMLLLDEIVSMSDSGAHARAHMHSNHPFRVEGRGVPAWVGMELMAQTIAAFSGRHARQAGEPVRLGYLLGARAYDCERDSFPEGAVLDIHVREDLRQDNGFGAFSGTVELDGEILASGRLNVFQSEDVAPGFASESSDNHKDGA